MQPGKRAGNAEVPDRRSSSSCRPPPPMWAALSALADVSLVDPIENSMMPSLAATLRQGVRRSVAGPGYRACDTLPKPPEPVQRVIPGLGPGVVPAQLVPPGGWLNDARGGETGECVPEQPRADLVDTTPSDAALTASPARRGNSAGRLPPGCDQMPSRSSRTIRALGAASVRSARVMTVTISHSRLVCWFGGGELAGGDDVRLLLLAMALANGLERHGHGHCASLRRGPGASPLRPQDVSTHEPSEMRHG